MKAGKNGGNLEIGFFICFLFTIFKHLSEVEMHFESNINDAVFGKRFYIVEIIPGQTMVEPKNLVSF